MSHDTYNGIGAASDGLIYYILCSEDIEIGAQMYSFDPVTERIVHRADLTAACGETNSVCQGKSHVPFVEADDRLWFATHIGYYDIIDGKEMPGAPPPVASTRSLGQFGCMRCHCSGASRMRPSNRRANSWVK